MLVLEGGLLLEGKKGGNAEKFVLFVNRQKGRFFINIEEGKE